MLNNHCKCQFFYMLVKWGASCGICCMLSINMFIWKHNEIHHTSYIQWNTSYIHAYNEIHHTVHASSQHRIEVSLLEQESGQTLATVSNSGMRTNLMKPICAVGLVTFSRSMKGATGSPSSFSRSDWSTQNNRSEIIEQKKLPATAVL